MNSERTNRPSTTAPNPRPTVALTGASGFVGRYVARALAQRGCAVRALVRDFSKARAVLAGIPCTPVEGDVFDPAAMAELCRGAGAVINLIGIRREVGRAVTFERLHVEATARTLAAAESAGATRFLQMSALGARPEARSQYHRTKHAAEQLVRASALAWTIFRPSIIHGPDGEFMQMARGWVTGSAPPYRFLPYFFAADPETGEAVAAMVQPVSVLDVADAFATALGAESTIGEVYPLGGADVFDWPTLLVKIRDAVPGANRNLKPNGLSGAFASRLAQGMGAVGLGGLLPFGPDEPLMATEDNTCAVDKAREHFGYRPRPFESELRAYAAHIG